MDEERLEPFLLRVESSKPDEILKDWFTLTYGKKIKEVWDKIFSTRTRIYADYEIFSYLSFQRAMISITSRWARLLESLKKFEPHSPINLEVTLHRVPKYLELGK